MMYRTTRMCERCEWCFDPDKVDRYRYLANKYKYVCKYFESPLAKLEGYGGACHAFSASQESKTRGLESMIAALREEITTERFKAFLDGIAAYGEANLGWSVGRIIMTAFAGQYHEDYRAIMKLAREAGVSRTFIVDYIEEVINHYYDLVDLKKIQDKDDKLGYN